MNYDIARRLIMLRAEREGIRAEINMLRSIPCATCEGGKQIIDTEADREGVMWTKYTPCLDCESTGLAGGKEATRNVET